MKSVGYNFLCARPHGADPYPVHMSLKPPPPPCGHHKWMAPYYSRYDEQDQMYYDMSGPNLLPSHEAGGDPKVTSA